MISPNSHSTSKITKIAQSTVFLPHPIQATLSSVPTTKPEFPISTVSLRKTIRLPPSRVKFRSTVQIDISALGSQIVSPGSSSTTPANEGITEGLTWILVLGYVRKWHNAVAVFLSMSEGPPFESTPSKRHDSLRDTSLSMAGLARL